MKLHPVAILLSLCDAILAGPVPDTLKDKRQDLESDFDFGSLAELGSSSTGGSPFGTLLGGGGSADDTSSSDANPLGSLLSGDITGMDSSSSLGGLGGSTSSTGDSLSGSEADVDESEASQNDDDI